MTLAFKDDGIGYAIRSSGLDPDTAVSWEKKESGWKIQKEGETEW